MPDFLKREQKDILRQLGLTDAQIKLYIALLQHGIKSALELSRLTGINRQQIYEETEKLVQLGLLDITRKQRRKYIAASPEKLKNIAEHNVSSSEKIFSEVASLIPVLQKLPNLKDRNVVVKYYEGADRMKEAYRDELAIAHNTEILSFAGSLDDIFKFFSEDYWDQWNRTYVKQGTTGRMIVQDSSVAKRFAQRSQDYKVEIRYLKDFPLKINIDILQNVVITVSYYDELATWVESRILNQSYRALFEALWQFAQPF